MNILAGQGFNEIMQLAKSLDAEGSFQIGPSGLLELGQLAKTLDATTTDSMYDLRQLTQGRAITVENIDASLYETAEQKRELVFWNLLRKSNIRTVLDQWVEIPAWGTANRRSAVGKFTDENSFPDESGPTLERKVDTTKFVRDKKSLSQVLSISQTLADPNAILNKAAAITCLEAVEKGIVFGDSAVIPNEFDGLIKKLMALSAYNTVVDCRKTGSASGSKGEQITEEQLVMGTKYARNNHGAISDMVMPVDVKSDINVLLKNSVRVLLNLPRAGAEQELIAGVPIAGYRTEFGHNGIVYFHSSIDTFFPSGDSATMKPPSSAVGDSTKRPGAPAAAPTVLTPAHANEFGTGDLGDYYYVVTSRNAHGESVGIGGDAKAVVVAGDWVSIEIPKSTTELETGYSIYRSKLNASDGSDCGWIGDIAWDGVSASTFFYDDNSVLPGTSFAVMLSNAPETAAIDWRQLLQFVRIALAFGLDSKVGWPYLFLLYGYLRLTKPKMHVLFKNIAFSGSTFWG